MLQFVFLLFLAVSAAGLAQENSFPEPESAEAVPGAEPSNSTFYPEEEEKIYNGIRSQFRYPFYVAIMSNDGNGAWQLVCGGSLIDPSSVLSSSHCAASFTNGNGSQWEAWLNPYALSEQPQQRIPIAKATTTDYYGSDSYYNDIGIYTLSRPATINKEVSTICIGSYINYNNIKVELVGFGRQGCNWSPFSDILLYAKGTTISPDKCTLTRDDLKNTDNQLCAKLVSGNSNYAEQGIGDGGSPLFRQANGKFTQVGLVSYCVRMYIGDVYNANQGKSGCPVPGYPGVYATPAKHMDFIRRIAPNATLCYRTDNEKN